MIMKKNPIIGIVGGVGPAAGFDCAEKIIHQTLAKKDQDHIPVAVLSCPHLIGDRTAYLFGREKRNPGYAIANVISRLKEIGAEVIGIPCNTAHAPPIFRVITAELRKRSISVKLLNMIDETVEFIASQFPQAESIGLLATRGTYESEVYTQILKKRGYKTVIPDSKGRHKVHQATYDERRGIKSKSTPVSAWAAERISASINHLSTQGAECIILGCTEIPLALPLLKTDSKRLIDPNLILARALIRETYPQKLKPINI